eukprot:scaffold50902_cov61-Phaeocystis_antarctica.AAC.2
MRRSLVSLDSPAPEAGAAGAAGPDSLAPFRLGNASSRLPCAGKASFSAATSASPSRLTGRTAASPIPLLGGHEKVERQVSPTQRFLCHRLAASAFATASAHRLAATSEPLSHAVASAGLPEAECG